MSSKKEALSTKRIRRAIEHAKKTYNNTNLETKQTEKNELKFSVWHYIIPPSILSLLTTAFYYPSLKYPFQFDDLANITKKFDIRFSDPLKNFWGNRRWMGEWLNRKNFDIGRFDPYYYRVTNLIVHIATGALVFFFILEGCRKLRKYPFLAKNSLAIASITSALFLLHPLQTQAVSYAIQARLEGLATLFVMATLLLLLKSFQAKTYVLKYAIFIPALIVGFFSCGTKEIAIVTPLLAILMDWFFVAEGDWKNLKKRIWLHVIFATVIFSMFIWYLSYSYVRDILTLNTSINNNRGNILTSNALDNIKPFPFLISEFKVILHYLAIFIWPFSMSVEYDWKLSENFFAPDSFFPFLALALIFWLAIYSLVKNKMSYIGFGLIWFLITIAPRSTIIPSPELICDYKTYLSSIGWLFIFAIGFVKLFHCLIKQIKQLPSFIHSPALQFVLLIAFTLPFGYASMNRNLVWSTSVKFWQDIVKKAPMKARGHNNLGVAMSEAGNYKEAIPYYLEAIRLDRHYSDPWSNLSVAYSFVGDIDKAITVAQKAINIFRYYAEAYNNLGTLLLKQKKYDQAEKILQVALKIRPYYGKAFYNLARLYSEKGENEKALEYFEKSTTGDLDTLEGFFTLGQMNLKMKKYPEAIKAFEMALLRGTDATPEQKHGIMFNLGNAYFMHKQLDKAHQTFKTLVADQPNDHRSWYNLGETLYSKQDFSGACNVFKKLCEPPFNIAQATFRYANCLEKTKNFTGARTVLESVLKIKNAPEEMLKTANNEIGRLKLQEKINGGNCTITGAELKQMFAAKA